MNFFEAQDNARRKTWQLIALFAGAVLSLILLTNLLVAAVVFFSTTPGMADPASFPQRLAAMPASSWITISLAVVGVVGVACLYKYLSLRGGGRAVAEMLGGSLLTHDTASGNRKRLLNVVEEMAIASGIPVPPVYLMPEPSINAFAAGLSADDAVIGVNQGTIDNLSRDELQGVVAHEFSHILNGDTRINLRLIAALHGIVFLSMIGHTILRGFRYGGSRRSNSSNGVPVLALGAGLLIIGYAGTFFGNLIKAAVSRQREYLADAAAVQFTRNPHGIADALKKIGGLTEGSRMQVAAASEASHMFFGQVQRLFLNSIMATHPPLPKRIRAIEPHWDGNYIHVETAAAAAMPESDQTSAFGSGTASTDASAGISPEQIIAEVGTLTASGLAAAQKMIAATEERLRQAAHDSWGARGLLYAMLLDADPEQRSRQLELLDTEAETGVPGYTRSLQRAVDELDAAQRLTLVEMAMPALKALSRNQYQRFVANVIRLIKADRQISLFEWVLHRVLLKELRPHFEGPRRVRARYRSIERVADAAGTLLATIARTGHPESGTEAAAAFAAGAALLDTPLEFRAAPDPNYQDLNQALAVLRQLQPLAKPKLLKACAATALADDRIGTDEVALLQGIAAALDCPLPPSVYRSGA